MKLPRDPPEIRIKWRILSVLVAVLVIASDRAAGTWSWVDSLLLGWLTLLFLLDLAIWWLER